MKLNFDYFFYRFVTKPLVIISLMIYYLLNHKERLVKRKIFMTLALLSFLFGDIFLLLYENFVFYIIGIVFFVAGKFLYALRFSNQQDFKLYLLVPFLLITFLYMVFLMDLVYDKLGNFFIPVMIYLFACLIILLFAFLRKNEVKLMSYILVLIGILFFAASDTIVVLQQFYNPNILYHKITTMLFYGLAQYFIVLGVVREFNDTIFAWRITA